MLLNGTVDETVACVCLIWSTHHEVHHSLRQREGICEHDALTIEEWFGIELLETLQSCEKALRANHAVAPFSKKNYVPNAAFLNQKFLQRLLCVLLKCT